MTRNAQREVDKMIAEPLKPIETKKMDYAAMAGKNFRTPAPGGGPTSARERTKK
jgi:hypothetical protein